MSRMMLLLGVLSFCSCKTVEVWDQGYPRSGSELGTDAAKKVEFNKFAIAEGEGGYEGFIRTQSDRSEDSNRYYKLSSYTPVLAKISPEAVKNYAEMKSTQKYTYIAVATLVGSLMLRPENSKSEAMARNVLYGIGLGGIVGVSLWQGSIFTDLKSNFNNDLNRFIYDDKKAAAADNSALNMGLSAALNF